MSPFRATATSAGWLNGACSDGRPRCPSEHDLAFRRQLEHLVLVTVAEIDVAVRTRVDAVRVDEAPLAPAVEEIAFAVEHEDRRILALVEVHAVLRIHGHVADVPGRESAGSFPEGADDVVHVIAHAHDKAGCIAARVSHRSFLLQEMTPFSRRLLTSAAV